MVWSYLSGADKTVDYNATAKIQCNLQKITVAFFDGPENNDDQDHTSLIYNMTRISCFVCLSFRDSKKDVSS